MKKIFHDSMLSFGKYKGLSVLEAIEKDPSYFIWLHSAKTHELDSEITDYLSNWARENPKQAERAKANGIKAAAMREAVGVEPPKPEEKKASFSKNSWAKTLADSADRFGVLDEVDYASGSVTTEVEYASAVKGDSKAEWGTW